MGTAAQMQHRWDQDALEDCSPEDRVWGWSIWVSEVFHHDQEKIGDDCLIKMLRQGILDKQAGAPVWANENSEVKHGVRFVSSMIVRVIQRCLRMDDEVTTSIIMLNDRQLIWCCLDPKDRRGPYSCD